MFYFPLEHTCPYTLPLQFFLVSLFHSLPPLTPSDLDGAALGERLSPLWHKAWY